MGRMGAFVGLVLSVCSDDGQNVADEAGLRWDRVQLWQCFLFFSDEVEVEICCASSVLLQFMALRS